MWKKNIKKVGKFQVTGGWGGKGGLSVSLTLGVDTYDSMGVDTYKFNNFLYFILLNSFKLFMQYGILNLSGFIGFRL